MRDSNAEYNRFAAVKGIEAEGEQPTGEDEPAVIPREALHFQPFELSLLRITLSMIL
jgi:hypothetical protein